MVFEGRIDSSYECPKCNNRHDVAFLAIKRFLRNRTSHAEDRRQEEEPMDWENVPFLPEVSALFVPSRPPRKMRSLISVQVSEPPSLSANRFLNIRALVPKTEGGVSVHSRDCPEGLLKRAASMDLSSRPPSGVSLQRCFSNDTYVLSKQCQLSN
ncbi:hypothetical protein TNCV_4837481 [Trichonephila clavipes]|nr:hypothetical protein TNCV_4837481 [Trichonephila clavipes]